MRGFSYLCDASHRLAQPVNYVSPNSGGHPRVCECNQINYIVASFGAVYIAKIRPRA